MTVTGVGWPVSTIAIVLTHRRRRLATGLVRDLILVEGFSPEQVLLVIDRDGGLEDPDLEAAVRVVRLSENSGPAAGIRAGLEIAFGDPSVRYAYVCEDDVGLMGLPAGRVQGLLTAIQEYGGDRPVGAVVAYGRRFGRGGRTHPYAADADGPRLQPIDVASWGATIVSRQVYDAGARPDDFWFFAYEDFDFFLQISGLGLAVLVDRDSALATAAATLTSSGRDQAFAGERPDDSAEPWRAYYPARNMFELARRHGRPGWIAWHLLLSARRWQLAPNWATRRALLVGLWHGMIRRRGKHPGYVRTAGELTGSAGLSSGASG